jgi:hypothetical protein
MNELVECHACSRPGWLKLDVYPPVVHHGPLGMCELPPRDDVAVRPRFKRPDQYASPYREVAS